MGDTISGYEVVEELSSGGMATLYLCRRKGAGGFRKPIALKVVHRHLAKEPRFIRMFFDEARLSAQIEHPNCVHVVELGVEDGVYFLAMEYVAGFSLSDVLIRLSLSERRLTPTAAVHITMKVAAGLHAAHELTDDEGKALEVVHRDVSPQNILLADKGYVKLIDFGIAKALGSSTKTATGALKGKFRYMSPEQARGEPIDRTTDTYALGIVLWEMLTMRRVFHGLNDLALLREVQNPYIVSPRRYAPDVSDELEAVVMKALSQNAADRFATAREMQQALAAAVPEAATMDAPDLSGLLASLMVKEADERRRSLPKEVAPETPPEATVETQVEVHTRSVIKEGDHPPIRTPTAPTDTDLLAARARAQPVTEEPAATELEPAPSKNKSWLIAGLLLLGAGAGVGGLYVTSTPPPPSTALADKEPEPKPLPPAVVAEPVEPPEAPAVQPPPEEVVEARVVVDAEIEVEPEARTRRGRGRRRRTPAPPPEEADTPSPPPVDLPPPDPGGPPVTDNPFG